MTNEQKVLFDLLLEIREICQENDIDMYLTENLLLDAYKNGEITGTYHNFTVCIQNKDVKKFIAAANKKENRFVESLLNNPSFPNAGLKYVKEDSLYYCVDEYKAFRHNGFAINIKILRNRSKNKYIAKVLDMMETGLGPIGNKGALSKKKIIGYVFNIPFLIMTPAGRAKFIFNKVNDIKGKNAKSKYYHTRIYKKKAKFEKTMLAEQKEILLCGETFKIPADEKYLRESVGNINKAVPMPTFGATYIIDKDISYKDFFKECKKQGFSNSFYSKKFRLLIIDGILSVYRKDIRYCWNLLYRTRDRFLMWEKYMPLKEEIVKLYEEENWTELETVLSDYIAMIEIYAKKRMGIAFDPEIFDITVKLLKKTGSDELAHKAKKYMPKQYLIPLSEDLGIE